MTIRRTGVTLAAVALFAGTVGCQNDDKSAKDSASSPEATQRTPAQALDAAFEKTSDAKSAKVDMTVSAPSGSAEGGDMEMSGVMGWNPTIMDMTVSGSMFGGMGADAPEKLRMVWVDNVMYMDMGTEAAAQAGGKRWMKLDVAAAAEASGDEKAVKAMTAGLEEMNQDPSQQLAMLLDSPNLKHIGPDKVDGEAAEHYKGRLTLDEMTEKNAAMLEALSEKERKQLVENMKKAGIKGYDTEVWVNEDDYPVKMVVGIDSREGLTKVTSRYSDYGAAAKVEAPPAGETIDLMEMLKELGGSGAGSGL
ncbi:hypothetical protein [Streptomyces meridianus]|nr:hypothetical protein [Streptomyces meridianus]